jgi:hypothetical protein
MKGRQFDVSTFFGQLSVLKKLNFVVGHFVIHQIVNIKFNAYLKQEECKLLKDQLTDHT